MNQLTIEQIVENRNQVVSLFEHGIESINKALGLSKELMSSGAYLNGWHNINPDEFKKEFDRKIWRHLFLISGTSQLMNADQKAELEDSMKDDVPKVCKETIKATLLIAKEERAKTFIEGLIGTLQGVCSSYKNNKAFAINKKLIFNNLDGWGEYASKMKDRMVDIERMIHIANGENAPKDNVRYWLSNMIGKRQTKELKYFTIQTFKNGNAHFIINCKGTLNKLNSMIAEHYEGKSLAEQPQ